MATLEPRADKAVRDAVDAFMDGRFVPEFVGETVFETKNSRYRLVDGIVFSAPDASLVGAELVGWLCESPRRCLVESLWQPGSRAVLVDRRNARNIIVTSTTRLLHAEDGGSPEHRAGSPKSHSEFRSWHPPPMTKQPERHDTAVEGRGTPLPFSPRHAAIIPSTPAPVGVMPTPPPPSSPKRGVHAPPRPIASPSRPSASATPIPAVRPLPAPTPPPRRESPRPAPAPLPAVRVPAAPAMPQEWEITSAEIEIEPDTFEPETVQQPVIDDDAMHNEATTVVTADGAEPVNSVPFPLVRPV